jgi:hypothetical protein
VIFGMICSSVSAAKTLDEKKVRVSRTSFSLLFFWRRSIRKNVPALVTREVEP